MDLFGGDAMAAGYGSARPAVHPEVLADVLARGGVRVPVPRVLDVGCGAGASTRALGPWARSVVGVDSELSMVRAASIATPGAQFVVGAAEALPVGHHSVDIVTAAGVLNFVDLVRFGAEAARVLTNSGVIVAYDFATGARSPGRPPLADGYREFERRWPRPTDGRHPVNTEGLTGAGFGIVTSAAIAVGIDMSAKTYVDYLMTESNVVAAMHRGESGDTIRQWCRDRFGPVFDRPRRVEFDAWHAVVTPPS